MWRPCIIISYALSYFLGAVIAEGSATTLVLTNIGPVVINFFEDVGSQEIVYVQIPSTYLSSFTFQWTFAITTKDESSPKACPTCDAIVLIRQNGIPIPNPLNASYPDNTVINNADTVYMTFPITASYPDEDKFRTILNRPGDTTGEFYVSLFLGTDNPNTQVPSNCKYLAELTVISSSVDEYNQAVVESVYEIQSLNSPYYEVKYSLGRHRTGILNTEYATLKEGYNLTLNSSTKYSWIVEPYADVGGTLRIILGFQANYSLENGTILKSCLSRNSNGLDGNAWNDCTSGQQMVVDSRTLSSGTWYFPYPASGLWVLDVGMECTSEPCRDISTIHLEVNIITCIESCHSQSSQGDCKLYRSDVLFFAACDCKGGWRGIACTDGTHAVPHSRQLLMTLLLTLSNLIFLPCAVIAIIRRYYSESIVYFFVMFFSTFYHACDNDFAIAYCLVPYNTLQFSDFYGSITAMWVTLIAIAKLPFRQESFFHVIGIMAIGVAVTYNRFSALTTLIPVLGALLILALKWGSECRTTRHCYPKLKDWVLSIIPGSICGIVGFILFAFVESSSNYFYVHSLWHVLMGSAVLFLIPREKKHSWSKPNQVFSAGEVESMPGIFYDNISDHNNGTTVLRMEISDSSSNSS